MFEASHPFAFFDYFRVPYQVRPLRSGDGHAGAARFVHVLRTAAGSAQAPRSLFWASSDTGPPSRARPASWAATGWEISPSSGTWCRMLPSRRCSRSPAGAGVPPNPFSAADGERVAAVWRDTEGNVFLPFDPGEVMRLYWSEGYLEVGRSAVAATCRAIIMRGYYLARPAMPRVVQLWLRRRFTRVQAAATFPAWPIENSLHDFYGWLFDVIADLAAAPVPFLDLWPSGRSWALVLTHDVETDAGYREMNLLRAPERARGYRSSWNLVGARYEVDDEKVRSLHDDGCEVGVHGLLHDGRDLSARRLDERLPAMWANASRWDAVGFRSPATHRSWDLMHRLGFGYDTSYSDTDPYEPQAGGCCSFLPYFNQDMVELPITLRRITPCSPSCSIPTGNCGCGRLGTFAIAAAWSSCSPTLTTHTTSG